MATEASHTDAPLATAAAGAPDLRVRGLAKAYGRAVILDGVDLEVSRGEAVALLGANGAGKSTLLRCCLKLVGFEAGTVDLLDQPVHALEGGGLRRVRAQVGFVFQRHNLVRRLSVLDNVLHGVQARAFGPTTWFQALAPAAWREEALACLDQVGLAHLARRRADQLSGGQSQRVAIARALMQRPRVVFADEPVASLDPQAAAEVMNLFGALMRRAGRTFVFTTHNLDHALAHADRVVGLKGGRIELDAPVAAIDHGRLHTLYAEASRRG